MIPLALAALCAAGVRAETGAPGVQAQREAAQPAIPWAGGSPAVTNGAPVFRPPTRYGSPPAAQAPSFAQGPPMGGATPALPYGNYPAGQQSAVDTSPPRVELQLSDPAPYVRQDVILTLQVSSGGNLAEASPELPSSGATVIRPLDGPRSSARQRADKREIVNEFRYVLTPLESGEIVLPPVRVRGVRSGSRQSFDVSSEPLRLTVRPPAAPVQPWLPLYHLAVRGNLSRDPRPTAGNPMQLTVEVTAVGTVGSQLPSAEAALRSAKDFKIYLEDAQTEGGVTPDGRFLTGRRLERYTVVPQHGGKLHIPAVPMPWFNLGTGQQETTELPIRQIVAEGPPPDDVGRRLHGTDIVPSGGLKWLFWAPLLLIVPVVLGYWVMVFSPPPAVATRASGEATPARRGLGSVLGSALRAVSPWRLAEWLRPRIASALPVAARLWFCLRIVEREDDPEDWAMLLKFLSQKHLGIPAQLPLPELGDRICAEAARRADPERVRALMTTLDSALYGGQPIGDFAAWKRAFRRETRPRLLPRLRRRDAARRQLPALNPSGKI
jgi:hypothetical protein